MPGRQPPSRRPGLVLTGVLVAYSAVVFAWWPTGQHVMGIALAAWLMLGGAVLWTVLGVVYVVWTERVERAEARRHAARAADRPGSE